MCALVETTCADGIATVAMNDPGRRNALSADLVDGLLEAFDRARSDPQVRCVVLTSTHSSVWCAGGDLGSFGPDAGAVGPYLDNERVERAFTACGKLGKPVICAANGHVLAGGLGLALGCDLIIAKRSITFGTPEINIGLFPFMVMALMARNVPRKAMTELMMIGDRISATEAREMGFVNRVVDDEEFDGVVAGWATKLAAKSPLIMRLGKDALARQDDMPLEDALEYLRGQVALALTTDDLKEGVAAFFEKRAPAWHNR